MVNTTVPHTTCQLKAYETPSFVCDPCYMFPLCVPQDHSILLLPKIMYRQFNGEKYLVRLHHTHPRDEMNNPCLHTFPEDNLSRLTRQTDSMAVSL